MDALWRAVVWTTWLLSFWGSPQRLGLQPSQAVGVRKGQAAGDGCWGGSGGSEGCGVGCSNQTDLHDPRLEARQEAGERRSVRGMESIDVLLGPAIGRACAEITRPAAQVPDLASDGGHSATPE